MKTEGKILTSSNSASSLAIRMTIWNALSSFLLVLIATGLLYHALFKGLAHQDDAILSQNAENLRLLLGKPKDELEEFRQELVLEQSSHPSVRIWLRVLDPSGNIMVETPGMEKIIPSSLFPNTSEENGNIFKGKNMSPAQGRRFRGITVHADLPGDDPPKATFQIALDIGTDELILSKYRQRLWLVLGFSLLGCAFFGYWAAHNGIRPVEEISESAANIRSTTLHERLEVSGLPKELFKLATTFNLMLERLEESFSRLSRFSADIAHEFRTPIHNLRGEVEVVLSKNRTPQEYQDLLGSSLEEYQRLSVLIDRLLFLARVENTGVTLQKEKINVGKELDLLRDYYELSAGVAGLRFEVEAPENLEISVDRSLFQRAVGNLLENSLKHTPAGGMIKLVSFPTSHGVKVSVSDTGKGIPEDQIPHVFDRFFRGDPARPSTSGGAGLGLSIVKSIMTLHEGTVGIESNPSRGTIATLIFPAS